MLWMMELDPIHFSIFLFFNYIYRFFLANILHILYMLSHLFQNKFMDIITINLVIKTDIVQIHMVFIKVNTYWNSETFNELPNITF